MTNKLFVYIAMTFLGIGILVGSFQDVTDFHDIHQLLVAGGKSAAGLAALFLRPPTGSPSAASNEGKSNA